MAEEEERKDPMETDVSDIRSSSSSSGAGETSSPSSTAAASSSAVGVVVAGDETAAAAAEEKHKYRRCCICDKAFRTDKALCGHMRSHPTRSWRGVQPPPTAAAAAPAEQQAAEQSIPVQELVLNISVAVPTGAGAGAAAGASVAAGNGTVLSDVKNRTNSSSSSAAGGGSGAHTCGKCGQTYATGQSLGGHMRKHYDGPAITMKNNNNKKRARELQAEEAPATTVERRVRRTDTSSFNGPPLESHNPAAALPSRSVQASDGGDCRRNKEEPERPSAGDGARRLHNFFPDEPAEAEEAEPKNAQQREPEMKDDDGDDGELLSLRLGRNWSGV